MTEQAFTLPVFKTEDYSIFKKLDGNRELYSNQVRRLVKILDRDTHFTKTNPIKVNEHMEVIDGQHRIEAFKLYSEAKGEKPSIYYTIVKGAGLEDARAINAGSKAWVPYDYATAYAQVGERNYKVYLKFADAYNINHNVLATYLTGTKSNSNDFRDGKFVVLGEKEASKKLDRLMEVGQLTSVGKEQAFGLAFYKIVSHPSYIHERMLEQMKKYGDGLNGIPRRQKEVLPAINMIYSWKRGKDRVDLLS